MYMYTCRYRNPAPRDQVATMKGHNNLGSARGEKGRTFVSWVPCTSIATTCNTAHCVMRIFTMK